MECNGVFATPCRTLDHQNPVSGIADDCILLLLDRTDDIL